MGSIERMVVLANSRKSGGWCIAGRAIDAASKPGCWLRPVVSQVADGLPHARTCCVDGAPAKVLDLIDVELERPVPHAHQRENRLLGKGPWKRCGRAYWNTLAGLAGSMNDRLWTDGFSSRCGHNDQVPVALLDQMRGSLQFIRTASLRLYFAPNALGQRKLRGAFSHAGRAYTLPVTDPVAWAALNGSEQLTLSDTYLCISLGVPFNGYAYKLVASVITEHRVRAAA